MLCKDCAIDHQKCPEGIETEPDIRFLLPYTSQGSGTLLEFYRKERFISDVTYRLKFGGDPAEARKRSVEWLQDHSGSFSLKIHELDGRVKKQEQG